ncbi:MAG TPA: methionyl-tRNA formyltransferase [Candidatus Protoclostridium stercorigallinarum]|uniref:Methionyl-tRNA formyltransferase n=1 Tax=Candidatus Protoclostridium stercorigallinarum TaxID=2838741 RepID=A0A9D1Q0Z7_9FIRM|nr:methionyl-tRNA formyltransferase [Candidatus Protoclostridium stercorigallinarum]
MRVLFMGTPAFALTVLEALCESRHEVVCAVTQPDKRGDRGALTASPVKMFAERRGIPVRQYAKVRLEGAEELRAFGADIFVTAAYGQLLSRELLDIAKYGTVNVHASLLPAYRGSCPVQRAIMNGDKLTGVTIMQTAEGLDTGDILLQKTLPIADKDTSATLMDKLASLGAEALLEFLDKLEAGEITPQKQDESKATYYPMLTKADGKIDWSLPADKIDCIIRGVTPWPGAYTFRAGKMLKVHRAHAESCDIDMPAGNVIKADKRGVAVRCGSGALVLEEVQLEGKKRMCCADFLNGCKLAPGEILG